MTRDRKDTCRPEQISPFRLFNFKNEHQMSSAPTPGVDKLVSCQQSQLAILYVKSQPLSRSSVLGQELLSIHKLLQQHQPKSPSMSCCLPRFIPIITTNHGIAMASSHSRGISKVQHSKSVWKLQLVWADQLRHHACWTAHDVDRTSKHETHSLQIGKIPRLRLLLAVAHVS